MHAKICASPDPSPTIGPLAEILHAETRHAAPGRRRMTPLRMLPSATIVEARAGGAIYARSPFELGPYPPRLTDRLVRWASERPDRVFLARRDAAGDWATITYRDTLARVRALAQALIDRRLSPDRPVVILSGNSLEHALIALASMYAGVMYAPIAPSYSLRAREFTTLRALSAALRPGLVFAAEGPTFERALAAVAGDVDAVEIVACSAPETLRATDFLDLQETVPTDAVDAAHRRVGPDTIAKVLYT
jgi:feruloyl-CoA synthase